MTVDVFGPCTHGGSPATCPSCQGFAMGVAYYRKLGGQRAGAPMGQCECRVSLHAQCDDCSRHFGIVTLAHPESRKPKKVEPDPYWLSEMVFWAFGAAGAVVLLLLGDWQIRYVVALMASFSVYRKMRLVEAKS